MTATDNNKTISSETFPENICTYKIKNKTKKHSLKVMIITQVYDKRDVLATNDLNLFSFEVGNPKLGHVALRVIVKLHTILLPIIGYGVGTHCKTNSCGQPFHLKNVLQQILFPLAVKIDRIKEMSQA